MTREEMREMIGGVAFMAALVALMAVFCAVTPMQRSAECEAQAEELLDISDPTLKGWA